MQGMGGGKCPFEFNLEPTTFKVGDTVNYRVESMADWPFAGKILSVHDDHIEIEDASEPGKVMRATREAHPLVSKESALD